MPSRKDVRPSSSPDSLFASNPEPAPWFACVSHPPTSRTATCGPSAAVRNFAAASISVLICSALLPRGIALAISFMPSAMSLEFRPCASRVAKKASFAYRSCKRSSVVSSASGSRDGAQLDTELLPRSTNGVFCASAIADSFPNDPPNGCRARLSQPSRMIPASPEPFSSTSWPSKCERERYGLATACTSRACLFLYSR